MAKLENVYCTYTGGNIYVVTAKYGDVYIGTDFELVGTYDVPYDDIEEKYECDYDSHEKKSTIPLPTWRELLESIRESYDSEISTNMWMDEVEEQITILHPNLNKRLDEEDDDEEENDDRHDTIAAIIEAFEDFLDEKGIVIPNTDKDDAISDGQEPESICNIYGTDYGILYDRIESILY